MRPPAGPPQPPANLGLCAACRWAWRVESARGSSFLRCGRSDLDVAYARYPRLPMQACAGFQTAGTKDT